jgi:hypothetical protein
VFGGLYADGGVPLPRGQDGHLIEELIDPSDQIGTIFGFVGDVMENLDVDQVMIRTWIR